MHDRDSPGEALVSVPSAHDLCRSKPASFVEAAAPTPPTSGTIGTMDLGDAQTKLRAFMAERDWSQFHSPENLAKSISIEAGELLECFQWQAPQSMSSVHDELADVLTYCLLLADALEQDPVQLITRKLEKSAQKYPAEKVKGKSLKYDQYED